MIDMAASYGVESAKTSIDFVPNVVLRAKTDRPAVPFERRSSMIEVLMRQRRDNNAENRPKGLHNFVSSTSSLSRQSSCGGKTVVDLPTIVGGKPFVPTLRSSVGDVKHAAGVGERRRSSCYQSVILPGPFSSNPFTGPPLLEDRSSLSNTAALRSRRNSLSMMPALKKNTDETSSSSRAGVLRAVDELRNNRYGVSKTTEAMNGASVSLNGSASADSKRNGGGPGGMQKNDLDCPPFSPGNTDETSSSSRAGVLRAVDELRNNTNGVSKTTAAMNVASVLLNGSASADSKRNGGINGGGPGCMQKNDLDCPPFSPDVIQFKPIAVTPTIARDTILVPCSAELMANEAQLPSGTDYCTRQMYDMGQLQSVCTNDKQKLDVTRNDNIDMFVLESPTRGVPLQLGEHDKKNLMQVRKENFSTLSPTVMNVPLESDNTKLSYANINVDLPNSSCVEISFDSRPNDQVPENTITDLPRHEIADQQEHEPSNTDISEIVSAADDVRRDKYDQVLNYSYINAPCSPALEVPVTGDSHFPNLQSYPCVEVSTNTFEPAPSINFLTLPTTEASFSESSFSAHNEDFIKTDSNLSTYVTDKVSLDDNEKVLTYTNINLPISSVDEVLQDTSDQVLNSTNVSCSSALEVPLYDYNQVPSINLVTFPTTEVPFSAHDQDFINADNNLSTYVAAKVCLVDNEKVLTYTNTNLPVSLVDEFLQDTPDQVLDYTNLTCSLAFEVPIDDYNQVPSINLRTCPTVDASADAYDQYLVTTNGNMSSCVDQTISHTNMNVPNFPTVVGHNQTIVETNHNLPISPNFEVPIETFDQLPGIELLDRSSVEDLFYTYNQGITNTDNTLLPGPPIEDFLHDHDELNKNATLKFPSPTNERSVDDHNKVHNSIVIDLDLSSCATTDVACDLNEVIIKKGNLGLGFCIGESINSAGNRSICVKRVFTSDTCVQGCLLAGDEIVRVNDVEMLSISSAAGAWKLIKSISSESITLLVRRNNNV